MPKERGNSKRGVQYYSALSRHDRLSPSQLALIARFSSPGHNSQGSSVSPPSSPHSLHGNISNEEEVPLPSEHIPLATSPPPQKKKKKISTLRTRIMVTTTAWWRRKSPRAGRWKRTRWSLARTRKRSGLSSVKIVSRRSTSNLSLKFDKNKMIRCTHSASSTKD